MDLGMKIQYRNNTVQPNHSLYCIDCAYDYAKLGKSCFGLCAKTRISSGFSVINDCKVLEL